MLNGMLDGIPESGDRYIYSEYQAFFEDIGILPIETNRKAEVKMRVVGL
jgi:hypothetical protein